MFTDRSDTPASELAPTLMATLEAQIARSLYVGAQVYASIRGRPVLRFGVGMANDTQPMTPETPVPLLCCVKPFTSVAISRLLEEGRVSLSTPLADVIPEFARDGKSAITVKQILTHTSPVRRDPIFASPRGSREAILEKIFDINVVPAAPPSGNYSISWGWIVLGELVRRLRGATEAQVLRDEVLHPLGLGSTQLGLSLVEWERQREVISDIYLCRGPRPAYMYDSSSERSGAEAIAFYPSTGGLGTAADLGGLLEFIAGWRAVSDPPISSAMTACMVHRHREGIAESSSGQIIDFGLGIELESRFHPSQVAPFSFGPNCSHRTFGHRSYQCSMMFADPACGLTFVLLTNGINTGQADEQKCRDATSAIYEDLRHLL